MRTFSASKPTTLYRSPSRAVWSSAPPEITSPCGTPPLPRPFSSLKPPAFVPATPPYLATSSVSCKPGVFALNSSLETPRMTREGSRTISSLPLAVPRVMAMSSTPSSAVSVPRSAAGAMRMREVLTVSVSSFSVLSLLKASTSSCERKMFGIHRIALVSRMERQNFSVMVGEGPFSSTQITPRSVISSSASVTRRNAPSRPSGRAVFFFGLLCSFGCMKSFLSGEGISIVSAKTDDCKGEARENR